MRTAGTGRGCIGCAAGCSPSPRRTTPWRSSPASADCYSRGLWLDPADPRHVLLGAADSVRRKQGRIERTRDGGRTWTRAAWAPRAPGRTPVVERFTTVPGGLVAILSDGRVLEQRDDAGRWEPLALAGDPGLDVRAACVARA